MEFLQLLAAGSDVAVIAAAVAFWRIDKRLTIVETVLVNRGLVKP